eukprot:1159692-Pelagomonas_calceolata.AAC.5
MAWVQDGGGRVRMRPEGGQEGGACSAQDRCARRVVPAVRQTVGSAADWMHGAPATSVERGRKRRVSMAVR